MVLSFVGLTLHRWKFVELVTDHLELELELAIVWSPLTSHITPSPVPIQAKLCSLI